MYAVGYHINPPNNYVKIEEISMGCIIGIITTFLLLIVLGWKPYIGPIIAGLIRGYIVEKGAIGGLITGFVGGLLGGILLTLIFMFLGSLIGPLGALIGLIFGGIICLLFLPVAVLAEIGGLIGVFLASRK